MTPYVHQTSTNKILLPYQQRWLADKSQIRLWDKGRRIGASWVCAFEAVVNAIFHGRTTWYMGYNKDMAREYINDVRWWVELINRASKVLGYDDEDLEDEDDILNFFATFSNGARICSLSGHPRNLRNKKGDLQIDECAHADDFAGIQKAGLAARIWGYRVSYLSTQNGWENEWNELIQEVLKGRKKMSIHQVFFPDAVKEGLVKRIFAINKWEWSQEKEDAYVKEIYDEYGPDADEELDGNPSRSSGPYLPLTLIERRMNADIPVLRFEPPEEMQDFWQDEHARWYTRWLDEHLLPILKRLDPTDHKVYGLDFARKVNLSVFWPECIKRTLRRTTPFVLEMMHTPYEGQLHVLSYIVSRLVNFKAGWHDGTGNGGYLAEAMKGRFGLRIIAQHFNPEFWRTWSPKFKAALEDGDTELPMDREVKDDHRALTLVNGIAKIPLKAPKGQEKKATRHGDSCVAHVLSTAAAMSEEAVDADEIDTWDERDLVAIDGGRSLNQLRGSLR